MKHIYKYFLYSASVITITSCVDYNKLDFQVEKPLAIELQEEIDAYEDLRNYISQESNPNLKLGSGIGITNFTEKGVMFRLLTRNFNEVSPRSGMNHGAIVQSNGSFNMASVEDLMISATEAGTTVFGQALAWHLAQNGSYLRGLLSPLIVESPAFANDLDISGLSSGTFNGWSHTSGVSIIENEGMGGGVNAVKLVSGAGSSQPRDLQLVSPEIDVVPGHEYEVIFYIKSDQPGEGRVAFEGLINNTPVIDWTGSGSATETFVTSPGWTEIRFRISGFEGETLKVHFDLGYLPDVTYYLDINNMFIYDTQGEPIINNLIENGDFESGTGWGGWGNNSERGVTEPGQGVGNEGRAFWVLNPVLADFWSAQTLYELPGDPIEEGETYTLSFWVKGDGAGVIKPELQSPDYSSSGFGDVFPTSEWQHITLTSPVVNASDRNRFVISYGEYEGTVYIDNVQLYNSQLTGGSTTVVEKTPEEKTAIISGQLEHWISGMVSSLSPYIKAWDVVKDPMDDANPSELRIGGEDLASGQFYWQDYIGKDYGVIAFNAARANGNDNDLLFISDHNLDNNLDKCNGLIDYVAYIEAQGAQVDGISTQMNMDVNADKEKIVEMFKLLANTGKFVKISELNIGLGVAYELASQEDFVAQREMYKFVVEKYLEHVPAGQQYGVTVWNPVDNSTGLWTEGNMSRKPAYAGVADGLGVK